MAGSALKNERRRIWTEAIKRALEQRMPSKDIVDQLAPFAENLLKQVEKGDVGACKELADRLEGKATEYVNVSTDNARELTDTELHAIASRGSEGTAGTQGGAGEPSTVH